MPRRRPSSCAQQMAPEGLPGGGDRRRRDPLLPRLLLPELRAASGTGASGGSRASEGGAEWWEAPTCRCCCRPRSWPTSPGNRRRGPGQCEDPRRGSARENLDSLGDFLGELLPGRSRQFLCQLRPESAKQPRPPTSSPSQHQRSVSEHSGSPPQCPRYSFLPDLGGQSLYLKNSLKKILLHQIPALSFRRDHSQFTTVEKTDQPHTTQAPKLKAVLTHSSSGEGSGHRRRCCPFRMQFADETLRYTALRYWERSCAVRQGILENRTASGSAASEQVFGSVGRWLESLPKALYPRAKEDTMANSFGWDSRGLSTLEPKDHLSEDTSLNSSLPFIPRPTT
ncbi:LOW QUALITY PROTEIN: uncharacterized protein C9orf50 homolog [Delphinus delphis]|uniref:LOW QUALITY PROTEIN: uncharacterized protein C9orf50 homolog n=1 Tax=Delphinus delphis TaxID=9728 RepID=UPI0028C4A70F|nr:LOW QUALITY PROTEIN: uncharacterized protein C9orf50 homolog [Delphinus delphis]